MDSKQLKLVIESLTPATRLRPFLIGIIPEKSRRLFVGTSINFKVIPVKNVLNFEDNDDDFKETIARPWRSG